MPVFVVLLLACSGPVLDPGGPVIDLHTHCFDADCSADSVEASLGGQLQVAALGLEHYAVTEVLGDPLPEEVPTVRGSNALHLEVADSSDAVHFFASLDCLHDTPASDPEWAARCLEDADAWIEAGAVGFKDHAGKTWDGSGLDLALWVGGYNRLAGWCEVSEDDPTPNRSCQAQESARMPMDQPEWRAMVQGLVEERGMPVVTHAVPWRGADTQCGRQGSVGPCFEQAADAVVDFAIWSEANLSEDARRRIVIAHLGFLDQDPRLEQILDAGLSVDLTQTALVEQGCALRALVAAYPGQVVLGTDMDLGLSCLPRHYEAWMWALLGDADVSERYPDTCRGTLRPVGAALSVSQACGITLPADAHRAVLYDNAAWMLRLD